MASCLTIQTCCHYLHCEVDLWQNLYLEGIYASSLQTFSDSVHTFYICLVPKHYCFTMTHPVPIMDRALYDRDLHHKIVKNCEKLKWRQREFPASSFRFMLLKLCEYIPKSLCFTFLNRVEFIQCLLSESFGKLITPQNVDFQLLHQYVKVL